MMAETASFPLPRRTGPSKPYSGNAPLFDKDGYVHAVITAVKSFVRNEGTKDEWTAYQWLLESEGTLRPWFWSELTVTRVRPPNREGKLNALAQWMTRLAMRTVESLKPEDIPLDELQSAIGRSVRFHTFRKDGYYRVDMDSLSLYDA